MTSGSSAKTNCWGIINKVALSSRAGGGGVGLSTACGIANKPFGVLTSLCLALVIKASIVLKPWLWANN